MSTEPTFPEDAYAVLIHQFHRPYFLEKLARDWGVVPQNEAEELQLLEAAAMLRQQKEAAAADGQGSFLTEACDNLKQAVAGLGGPAAPTSHEQRVKQAAQQKLADPVNRQAIEAWGVYLAQLAQTDPSAVQAA